MTDPCGQAGAYFDGELDDADQAVFLAHLAGCAICQRDLDDAMQLDLRRPPTPMALRRHPLRRVAWIALPVAAAAAAVLILAKRPHPAPAPALALRATRSLEARLSYPGADRHRPFDVELGPPSGGEVISARVMAELEERGVKDAVAAGYLLAGEDRRAEAVLTPLPASPQRNSDMAAVQLVRGAPDAALELADRALARLPRFGPALWNRALALRQLALPLAAAAAFDAVAALGEPGWADEARQRAMVLRAEVEDRRTAWKDAFATGKAMTTSDHAPVMTADQARRVPGLARLYFYDAVRTATSSVRLAELAPLARVLDEIDGGTVLARTLERASHRDLAARRPLAEKYRALIAAGGITAGPEADESLASFRHARTDDLALGGLLYTGQAQSRLDELTRLADATDDPWFALLARGEAAQTLHNRGEDLAAESALHAALATCRSPGVAYRCMRLKNILGNIYLYAYRTSELRQLAIELGTQASATGDWWLENQSMIDRAEAERLAMRLPILRGLFTEIALREPDDCSTQEYLRQVQADVELLLLDVDGAARHLDDSERCGPISPTALADIVDVARLRPSEARRAAARNRIEEYRRHATPAEIPWATVIEGRFELDVDRVKGMALLREGIRLAEAQPALGLSKRARTIAYTSLIIDAAAANKLALGLEIFSAAASVSPEGCILGVALDDNRAVAIARLADGSVRGVYDPDRRRALTDLDAIVPPELAAALAPCDHVSVLALPPLHGRAHLLPPELPWAYRSAPGPSWPPPSLPRNVVIADPMTPAHLHLPQLGPAVEVPGAEIVRGPAATPSRVERELGSAAEVFIHAHALVDVGTSDTAFLALSPDADGRFALTASDVRRLHLAGRPIIYLAACRTAEVAPQLHEAWSLAVAFVAAGARAVVASAAPLPDRAASEFFAALRRRVAAGEAPAAALAHERGAWLARDPASWVRDMILFE